MPKHHEVPRENDATAWPGPVGWWYVPLIWFVVLFVAALAWSFN